MKFKQIKFKRNCWVSDEIAYSARTCIWGLRIAHDRTTRAIILFELYEMVTVIFFNQCRILQPWVSEF